MAAEPSDRPSLDSIRDQLRTWLRDADNRAAAMRLIAEAEAEVATPERTYSSFERAEALFNGTRPMANGWCGHRCAGASSRSVLQPLPT